MKRRRRKNPLQGKKVAYVAGAAGAALLGYWIYRAYSPATPSQPSQPTPPSKPLPPVNPLPQPFPPFPPASKTVNYALAEVPAAPVAVTVHAGDTVVVRPAASPSVFDLPGVLPANASILIPQGNNTFFAARLGTSGLVGSWTDFNTSTTHTGTGIINVVA